MWFGGPGGTVTKCTNEDRTERITTFVRKANTTTTTCAHRLRTQVRERAFELPHRHPSIPCARLNRCTAPVCVDIGLYQRERVMHSSRSCLREWQTEKVVSRDGGDQRASVFIPKVPVHVLDWVRIELVGLGFAPTGSNLQQVNVWSMDFLSKRAKVHGRPQTLNCDWSLEPA